MTAHLWRVIIRELTAENRAESLEDALDVRFCELAVDGAHIDAVVQFGLLCKFLYDWLSLWYRAGPSHLWTGSTIA